MMNYFYRFSLYITNYISIHYYLQITEYLSRIFAIKVENIVHRLQVCIEKCETHKKSPKTMDKNPKFQNFKS